MRYTLYYQVYKDLVFQIAGLTTELTQLRVLRFLCGGPAGSVSCLACEPCVREALCPRLRRGLAPGPRPRAGRSGAVRERSCWVLGGCLLCSASVLGSSCPRRAAWGGVISPVLPLTHLLQRAPWAPPCRLPQSRSLSSLCRLSMVLPTRDLCLSLLVSPFAAPCP